MDSSFLLLLLEVFSAFNCLLSVLISSKRKGKAFFLGPALASKQAFFSYFDLSIALQSAVL
jgi:hypothetical protein